MPSCQPTVFLDCSKCSYFYNKALNTRQELGLYMYDVTGI